MTTDFEAFGKNVRAALEKLNKTQTWLAAAITSPQRRVETSTISDIVRGVPSLSATRRSTNAAIGKMLGVEVPPALMPAGVPTTTSTTTAVTVTATKDGFSFERAASTVQLLNELGLPTGEVKAAIMQRVSALLGG